VLFCQPLLLGNSQNAPNTNGRKMAKSIELNSMLVK